MHDRRIIVIIARIVVRGRNDQCSYVTKGSSKTWIYLGRLMSSNVIGDALRVVQVSYIYMIVASHGVRRIMSGSMVVGLSNYIRVAR